MYQIYIDDDLVYTSELNSVISTGFESAKVSLKVNNTNSFEYTVSNEYPEIYNKDKILKSIVKVMDDYTTIFIGRPIKEETDWYNNKKVTCEGALGYLYDSIQRPKRYTGQTIEYIFKDLLERHNEQVEDYKKIYPGTVTVIDKTDEKIYSGEGVKDTENPYYYYQVDSSQEGTQTQLDTKYETTFDAMNGLLLNNLAGYLCLRYEGNKLYLDYLKDYLPSEGQVIEFGENMLDFSTTLDYSSLCTGVIPLGYSVPDDGTSDAYDRYKKVEDVEDNRLTVKSVNNNSDTLWSENAVNTYGKIVKMVEWSAVKDATTLKEKGEKYLTNTQFDALTLNCKVIDLHLVDNNSAPLEFMHLVRVRSIPHDMDRFFPITEMNIDLMDASQNTITLGATYNTITGALANTEASLNSTKGSVSSINEAINQNNDIAWTNITKTNKAITLEAQLRETADNNIQTTYDAKFEVTAKEISSEVSARTEGENSLSTRLSQTATGFSATVGENGYLNWTVEKEDGTIDSGSSSFTLSADVIDFIGKSIILDNTNQGGIYISGDIMTIGSLNQNWSHIVFDLKNQTVAIVGRVNLGGEVTLLDGVGISGSSSSISVNSISTNSLYVSTYANINGATISAETISLNGNLSIGSVANILLSNGNTVATREWVNGQSYATSSELSEVKKSCEAVKAENTQLTAKYDTLNSEYNDLQSDHTSLQSSYNTLKSEYDSVVASYNNLNSEYSSYVSTHSHTDTEYNDLASRHKNLVAAVKNYRSEANKLTDTSESVINSSFHSLLKQSVN